MGFHRQRLDLLPVGGCHARAEFDIFFSCFSPIVAKSGSGLPPGIWVRGHAPPRAFGRAAASPQTRQMRCWPSSERTTNPSSRRKRQDSLSLSLVLFPPKPLRWVSAGALLGEVIKTPVLHFFGASMWGGVVSLPSACASCCRNAGRPRVTVAYLPFLCRLGICPVRAEYPLVGHTRHPNPEPRTQRLTRRNTAGSQGRW